jgi:RHS repeat-associated protein
MNNNGSSSSVVARHDYLPFGEEIGSGLGLRTSSQGYSAMDPNRWKYGMLQRDAATGLDHTWWRKYENLSGRWTSPDPLSGSIADPQSFNHYSYTQNDPVNFIDPSGLFHSSGCGSYVLNPKTKEWVWVPCSRNWDDLPWDSDGPPILTLPVISPSGGGGGRPQEPQPKREKKKCRQDKNGGDTQDIMDKLGTAGVSNQISNIRSAGPKNPEGILFDIKDQASFVQTINKSGRFVQDPAIDHAGQVGGNIFSAQDFRSYTDKDGLGPDSTGNTRSLQITVGPASKQPGGGARGYADLDCSNPAQDLVSFGKHNTPIVFRWLGKVF